MNKKILVIKPPYRMFPLGMAYVLSSLEKHGIDFDFTDANFGNDYKKLLKKNDYDAVATGGLISSFAFFNEVSRFARHIGLQVPLILGGGVTKDMRPEFLFDKLHFTYGIIGEAETSFPFLIEALWHEKGELETVPGLLYKDPRSGEIKKNPVRRLDFATADILPAWHRFDVDYYINDWEHGILGRRLCMPVISARGCTGTCTMCSNLLGDLSKRPVEQVIREIEILSERYTFDWVQFYNEMFYSTKAEIVKFCEAMKKIKHPKNWTCDLRVDAEVDIDIFRLMKSSGCVAVFGGLESGSNKILSSMQKKTTREMIIGFYRSAEAAGLPCMGTFLVGNEGETEADIKETVDMVTTEKMRTVEILISTYPGTKIYENAVKRGLINDEWDYLERLNFFTDIWDYLRSKNDYVNISDIPNDRFLEVVIGELRRFFTYNLTHFVPKNMTCSTTFSILIKVTGQCVECGNPVSYVTPRKMLGIRTFCGKCFRPIEFNLYEMPELSGHYHYLRAELGKTKKLAIIGTTAGAINLLKYDYFNLNYKSLAAAVELDAKPSEEACFFYLPRIRLEGLLDVQPDTVLVVDDQFGHAELKIRKFYLKKNFQLPRILHLLPDEKRPYAWFVRLARKYTSAAALNRWFVFSVIQPPLLIAEMQTWLISIVKSNFDALNGNAFFRMLVEKMRVQR
jgi:anaerobic magnesium-protoporphyrin IX monomethyl ester cyclase